MGLAEDLKALQELRDKGELSESAYIAARDAAIGKQGHQPVAEAKPKPLISTPTRVFLAVVILFVGLGVFMNIYEKSKTGQSVNLLHQSLTVTDEIENVPAARLGRLSITTSRLAENWTSPSGL